MTKRTLRITVSSNGDHIVILGDAGGLRHLSEVCLSVIGKSGPAAHHHLMVRMANLDEGSVDTDIVYLDQPAGPA